MPLIDTWTWMEYFDEGLAGAAARAAVEGPDVSTSVVTLAELSDVYARDKRAGLSERFAFIRSRGPILDVPLDAARRAGDTKWAQRARKRSMGLMDALIYETARHHGVDVVTGDDGLAGLPGVVWIRERPKKA